LDLALAAAGFARSLRVKIKAVFFGDSSEGRANRRLEDVADDLTETVRG
jgi:hypothetical protein